MPKMQIHFKKDLEFETILEGKGKNMVTLYYSISKLIFLLLKLIP